jgi:hypothetical protein
MIRNVGFGISVDGAHPGNMLGFKDGKAYAQSVPRYKICVSAKVG